jgi:phage terminase large subunit-like protein
MATLADDLALALDRVEFARSVGIEPDPWQRDLLQSPADRVLLNCSRQSGKSTMAAILALHQALYHPLSLVLILAPAERQAKELFGKVTDFYRELHGATPTQSDRKLGMHLANGSRIEALPGSERTIRGFSGASLLILDEAARVDDALYYAVRPMLAVSGGSLMLLSTPYGRRGVFFEEWTGGRPGRASRCRLPRARASLRPSSRPSAGACRSGGIARSTAASSWRPRTNYSPTR